MTFADRARECEVEGCPTVRDTAHYCAKHYKRWKRWGDTSAVRVVHYDTPEESFSARTREIDSGCIEWTGARYESGHGQIRVNGRMMGVHRYAWEQAFGPIPDGLLVDHKCWNRSCVNVDHLRLATLSQNNSYLSGARSNNKLGIRNVYRHGNGYYAQVKKDGVSHGGYFGDIEEAKQEAERLRMELFGGFAGKGVA